ncbi:hypothetical protein [Planococcus rifietoensis]|uniref:hypothetical protein n=1 Tax=Planococcus rifietoensis TaxID=200991 RepID=UPI0038511E25
MTKGDWIEIINMSSDRNWLDVIVIVVTIVSPILVLISVVYAAKSAMAAEKATNLNFKMYTEQKLEQEKAYYPIFEISGYTQNPGMSNRVELLNKNTLPITNIRGHVDPARSVFKYDNKTGVIELRIYLDFNDDSTAEFKLDYIALNHHAYTCKLIFHFREDNLFLYSQENVRIN